MFSSGINGCNSGSVTLDIAGLSAGIVICWVGLVVSSLFFALLGKRNFSRAEVALAVIPTTLACTGLAVAKEQFSVAYGLAIGFPILPLIAILLGYITQELSGTKTQGMGPSLFPISLIIRLFSTLRYAHIGFCEIPTNYKRTVLCTAINYPRKLYRATTVIEISSPLRSFAMPLETQNDLDSDN
jgi:hypothetical protein